MNLESEGLPDYLLGFLPETLVDRRQPLTPVLYRLPGAAELFDKVAFQQAALRGRNVIPDLLKSSFVGVIFCVPLHFIIERLALVWRNLSHAKVENFF
jgi:hypothetical protein